MTVIARETITAYNVEALTTAEDFAALIGQELVELDAPRYTEPVLWRATIRANLILDDAKIMRGLSAPTVARIRAGIAEAYRSARLDLEVYAITGRP